MSDYFNGYRLSALLTAIPIAGIAKVWRAVQPASIRIYSRRSTEAIALGGGKGVDMCHLMRLGRSGLGVCLPQCMPHEVSRM
jgi:hypothetical protein